MLTKNTIKQIASLRQQKFRKELGLFVVEGRKMTEELLRSSFEMVGLYATEAFLTDYPAFAEAETVSEVQMQQMSGQDTPPGILAVVRIPKQDEIKVSSQIVLALDGIANPGNMGTLIRTAEWFGIQDVVCSSDCVELWNPKVVQATMGAIARVKVYYTDLPTFLSTMRQRQVPVYGTFLEGENIYQSNLSPHGIIVMGNEGRGISDAVRQQVTHKLFIPPYPADALTSESLNVGIATAITVSEFRKRE
jgi:TrmH family RNA methyltransferase